MALSSKKSFTLIELLVALILIGVGTAAVAGLLTSGSYFLRRSENRARAVSLAHRLKEGFLNRSYENLLPTPPGDPIVGVSGDFSWTVNIVDQNMNNPTAIPPRNVPYRQVNIEVQYPETDSRGQVLGNNSVFFTGIKPYPYVHVMEQRVDSSASVITQGAAGAPAVIGDAADGFLSININYTEPKRLVVIYNIALDYTDVAGVDGLDLILTQSFVNQTPQSVQTGTPILTQPVINNVIDVGVVNPRVDGNTVDIRWMKDTAAGDIGIKRAEMIVVAYEQY